MTNKHTNSFTTFDIKVRLHCSLEETCKVSGHIFSEGDQGERSNLKVKGQCTLAKNIVFQP